MREAVNLTFNIWWQRFVHLAEEARFSINFGREAYREYFDDGDSPEDALDFEMDADEIVKGDRL